MRKVIEDIDRKQDYLENQSMRNNLIFRNVEVKKEGPRALWKNCEMAIKDVTVGKLGVNVEEGGHRKSIHTSYVLEIPTQE